MRINAGAWERDESGAPVLLMSRCTECGRTDFPPLKFCPECLSPRLERVRMGRTGTLYTFTRVHVKHPTFGAPYYVGYVDFPEGLRAFGQLRADAGALHIGIKVVVSACSYAADPEALDSYCFEPAEGDAARG